MALKIKKKVNEGQTKAVITVLGMIGTHDRDNNEIQEAEYISKITRLKSAKKLNTLPLLIENYAGNYKIIPIYTQKAKEIQIKVLMKYGLNISFDDGILINDSEDFGEIFASIDKLLSTYDKVIIDVSHGFRHLPLLVFIDLVIQNFKDTKKIEHILFAKETPQEKQYEIIDLKAYMELANISFILTNFNNNFTVSNHIEVEKYKPLLDALNNFSNDIMALSLNHLFNKSSKNLIKKLHEIDDVSIKQQADKLSKEIETLTNYEGKKRYQTYFDLSYALFDKNYMLVSLALLYESVRLYIKTTIKKNEKELVEKIEIFYKNDLYAIGDFFVKFKEQEFIYNKFEKNWKENKKTENIPIIINQNEFLRIKQLFPKALLKTYKYDIIYSENTLIDAIAYTRNNLAHGNIKTEYKNIKKGIKELIEQYQKNCINLS